MVYCCRPHGRALSDEPTGSPSISYAIIGGSATPPHFAWEGGPRVAPLVRLESRVGMGFHFGYPKNTSEILTQLGITPSIRNEIRMCHMIFYAKLACHVTRLDKVVQNLMDREGLLILGPN